MFHSEISSLLIFLALLTRNGIADHVQEDHTAGNQTRVQLNHTAIADNATISKNHTQFNESDTHGQKETSSEITEKHENITHSANKHHEGKDDLSHANSSFDHLHDKENVTAYWRNVTAEVTNVLKSIWQNQLNYTNGIDTEKSVVYQTYKVELKRITYLIHRIQDQTKKQNDTISKLNWNEIDDKQPQPYHEDVIGQLAKNWDEIERYFRENKLRGVDIPVRRINKIVQKAKEELSDRWDRLKKLAVEMERLKIIRL